MSNNELRSMAGPPTRECDLCGKPDSYNINETWLCDDHDNTLGGEPHYNPTKALYIENAKLRRDLARLRAAVDAAGYQECPGCGCLFDGSGPKCSGERCDTADELAAARGQEPGLCEPTVTLAGILGQAGMVASGGEARRLCAQGGVRVNGGVVRDPETPFLVGAEIEVGIGKRAPVRVKVQP